MSDLPINLIKEFVKATDDSKTEQKQTRFYGTASVMSDGIYVLLDGSGTPTPVSMATDAQNGDRVVVEIVDHSARILQVVDKSTTDIIGDRISNDGTGVFKELRVGKEYVDELISGNITADTIIADRAEIKDLKAENVEITGKLTAKEAEIEDLKASNVTITGKLTANEADIKDLKAENVEITGKLTATEGEFEELKAENAEITGKLTANEAEIENLKTSKLSADQADIRYANIENLNAVNASIQNLEVTKLSAEQADIKYASINSLNAINASIENLKTTKLSAEQADIKYASINSLNAINASIEELDTKKLSADQANILYASIADLQAAEADITRLNAATANISILETGIADINTLIFGSATGDTIQTNFANAVIAQLGDAQIKSAMIENISAGKITSGDIITNNVRVVSEDGSLVISDETIQISDDDRVRVQIGKDSSNDYSINIWDADGNLMFSKGGITDKAIKSAIIRNDMVSDNASISASKLDIDSLFTEINNSDKTIKSTKVYLDENKQTLEVAFKSLTTDVSGIDGRVSSQATTISAIQGQISSKIWQQDIDAATGGLSTQYSTLNQELNNFKASVASTYVTNSTFDSTLEEAQSLINKTVKEVHNYYAAYISGGVLLEEQEPTSNMDGWFVPYVDFVIGSTYTVLYNGVPYNCIAKPYFVENAVYTILGNTDWLTGEGDTGEPFVMATIPGADICLIVAIEDIPRTIGVIAVTGSPPEKPTTYPPEDTWSEVEPRSGNVCSVLCIVYADGTFNYSDVSTNTAGEIAANAMTMVTQGIETIKSMQSDLSVLEGEISAKVSSSTLESYKTTVANQFSSLTTEINNTKNTVASHTTSLSGITSKVESTESNITTINGSITSLTNRMNSAEQKITPDAIISTVSGTYLSKTDASKTYATQLSLTQTSSDLTALITESGKTATNYLNFSNAGLVIGDMAATTLGKNVLINSTGVNVRNNTTVLASFESNAIYLGKENRSAVINFCKDLATMKSYTIGTNEFFQITSDNIRLVGDMVQLESSNDKGDYTDIRTYSNSGTDSHSAATHIRAYDNTGETYINVGVSSVGRPSTHIRSTFGEIYSDISVSGYGITIATTELISFRDADLLLGAGNNEDVAITWYQKNSKNPYIGYCTTAKNGTFVICSTEGTTNSSGLAINSSGLLAWKGNEILNTSNWTSSISSGTLPVARGGTGITSNPSMLVNLASTTADTVFESSPRPGVTGKLPIANGGTGLNASPSLLVNLGVNTAANILTATPRPGVTGTLAVANGGTGADNASTARFNLGVWGYDETSTPSDGGKYPGLMNRNGTTTGYVRVTQSGLLPYQSGGHGTVGTESWPFNNGHFINLYGREVYMQNSYGLYAKDTGGTNRGLLRLSSANNFLLGDGMPGVGDTFVYGNYVSLRANNYVQFLPNTNSSVKATYLQIMKEQSDNKRSILRGETNAEYYLGTTSYRFNTAFFTNAITASDLKEKEVIDDFDFKIKEFIMGLKPIAYNRIGSGDTGKRIHMGLGAQDVYELIRKLGLGDMSLAQASIVEGGEERPYYGEEIDDAKLSWGLNYTELISPIILMLQYLYNKLEEKEQAAS